MNCEWSDKIQAFWRGGEGVEYIAWKGSHQVFVFPCGEYPKPPSSIIDHSDRIETLEDFEAAMTTGVHYDATYTRR